MRLASIDIGSNSVHMIIADVTGPQSFFVVDRERERVKLGAGAFKTGKLRAAPMQAALDALKRFALLCKRLGVQRIHAVATSAVREARNGRTFLAEVKRRTGIVAKPIGGKDEAGLIYRGIRHATDLRGRRALMLDLGGGSLEIMYGNDQRLAIAESLPLGVQRLRDNFGGQDPLPRRARERLVKHIRQTAKPVLERIRKRGIGAVICTSGTQMTLGLACLRLRGRDPWGSLNGYVIQTSELRDLHRQLIDTDAPGRSRLPGIDERRSDIVHYGSAVLATVLEIVGAGEFQLCGASLREGLLLQRMEETGARRDAQSVRVSAATELVQRTGGEPRRARRVADLSLRLFDGARRAHKLAKRERGLLEIAALVADLGRHLYHEDREHLTYQIVRGGGLRGLTDTELETVGLTARYSRGGAPKARHRHFAELDTDSQHIVRVLAGILRIADGLDRGRAGVVKDIRCRLTRDTLRISPVVRGDASLELWSATRAAKLFAQAVDLEVLIHGTKPR